MTSGCEVQPSIGTEDIAGKHLTDVAEHRARVSGTGRRQSHQRLRWQSSSGVPYREIPASSPTSPPPKKTVRSN